MVQYQYSHPPTFAHGCTWMLPRHRRHPASQTSLRRDLVPQQPRGEKTEHERRGSLASSLPFHALHCVPLLADPNFLPMKRILSTSPFNREINGVPGGTLHKRGLLPHALYRIREMAAADPPRVIHRGNGGNSSNQLNALRCCQGRRQCFIFRVFVVGGKKLLVW